MRRSLPDLARWVTAALNAQQQDRLAELGEMTAVIAHEIRNPLAALKGHAQLLAESLDDDSPERAQADRIANASTRLEHLVYELSATGLTVHDVVGDPSSALHLARAALSRVPADADDDLRWTDRLPLRPFLPLWLRPLYDLVSPLGAPSSLAMTYRARRDGAALVVEGRSERRLRGALPWVTTAARLAPGVGVVSLDVCVRGRRARVELSPASSVVDVPARTSSFTLSGGTAHA